MAQKEEFPLKKEDEKAPKPESQPEEGISLQALNKEVDMFSTDPGLVQEIDRDFLDVVREFSGDPDLELFKIKYETYYHSTKDALELEIRWNKKYFYDYFLV